MFRNKYLVVRTALDDVKEQTLENCFGETVSQDDNTTVPTFSVDDEKSNNFTPIKQYMRHFYFNKTLENYILPIEVPQRKSRTVGNGSINYGVKCLSCFANSSSHSWNCYAGRSVSKTRCADAEHCYIELNPKYIKRGCVLPGRVNRTFVCKCPLCNDKPSFDISHYEYKQLSDWEYDNARLQTPLVGMDIMCKVCETKGTNPAADQNCRSGKNANYMVCGNKQLCYTNIDDEADFVSRGCTNKPVLNSIYYFCNNTECNSAEFPNPVQRRKLRAEAIQLKDDRYRLKKGRKRLKSFGSKNTSEFCSLFMIIISTLIQCL